MTLAIKDWEKHFENHDSKKLKKCSWVPIPNKHDTRDFRRLAAHPRGTEIFAAWVLMVQVASKMTIRGKLSHNGTDLTFQDLSLMTGFPTEIFEIAVDYLCRSDVGWMICDNLPERRETPGFFPAGTEQNRTRTEQNRPAPAERFDDITTPSRDPKAGMVIDPIQQWELERLEPWARTLKLVCPFLGKHSWETVKGLVDRFGIELVRSVASDYLGKLKYASDLVEQVAIEADELARKQALPPPEPVDPLTTRGCEIVERVGAARCIEHLAIPTLTTEEDLMRALAINPPLAHDLESLA